MRFQTLWEARWIFGALLLLIALPSWRSPWLGLPGLALLLFTVYFFRDPPRDIPKEPGIVLSAADGVVADIGEVVEDELTHAPMKRVGVFLSVFNVHVNRAPVSGKVTTTFEKVGAYHDARSPDAALHNARRTWGLQLADGRLVVVKQITGAIARRIVPWSKEGDQLARGDRFGMIRFGSRTEVWLPLEAEILVRPGHRVEGGRTIIARFPGT